VPTNQTLAIYAIVRIYGFEEHKRTIHRSSSKATNTYLEGVMNFWRACHRSPVCSACSSI
jgi:hypothetical protein